ncbi:MAG: esterase [Bacteroidia bacterium]
MKNIILSTVLIVLSASNSSALTPMLHYVLRAPKVKVENPPLLVLLHGVGSNENDLFSFANELPDSFLVVSLRAPITLSSNSYAWFSVSFKDGKITAADTAQAIKSSALILKFITQLKTTNKFNNKQVYLCGFSQGAIMAYCVGLTNANKIKGIAALSGRILDNIKPVIKQSAELKQLRIFIAHGTTDNVIPVARGREANTYLTELGLTPTYKEYNEPHTISKATLTDVVAWLKLNK